MLRAIHHSHGKPRARWLSAFIAFAFLINAVFCPHIAYAQSILNLPQLGTMIPLSPVYQPALIKGLKIFPDNPLQFDFIIDPGDSRLEGEALKGESSKLIKYFLAALTIPEENLWVNLSPYEKSRIIPSDFAQTEMGRDLLAQDYLLKQITASLIYPEDELGQKFWDRVYKRAHELYGTTEIPVNTFNKVWIVPQKAAVYEEREMVFVADSYLKVMLEEDYVAMRQSQGHKDTELQEKTGDIVSGDFVTSKNESLGSQIIKEIIIPELEKEVNTGKNFANLRQIYHAVILATWFKRNLKDSYLAQVYVDRKKTDGVDVTDKEIHQKIYNQYLEAFKRGVYDYIREDYDPAGDEMIPRKYFSGGAVLAPGEAFAKREDFSIDLSSETIAAGVNLIAQLPEQTDSDLPAGGQDLASEAGSAYEYLSEAGVSVAAAWQVADRMERVLKEERSDRNYSQVRWTQDQLLTNVWSVLRELQEKESWNKHLQSFGDEQVEAIARYVRSVYLLDVVDRIESSEGAADLSSERMLRTSPFKERALGVDELGNKWAIVEITLDGPTKAQLKLIMEDVGFQLPEGISFEDFLEMYPPSIVQIFNNIESYGAFAILFGRQYIFPFEDPYPLKQLVFVLAMDQTYEGARITDDPNLRQTLKIEGQETFVDFNYAIEIHLDQHVFPMSTKNLMIIPNQEKQSVYFKFNLISEGEDLSAESSPDGIDPTATAVLNVVEQIRESGAQTVILGGASALISYVALKAAWKLEYGPLNIYHIAARDNRDMSDGHGNVLSNSEKEGLLRKHVPLDDIKGKLVVYLEDFVDEGLKRANFDDLFKTHLGLDVTFAHIVAGREGDELNPETSHKDDRFESDIVGIYSNNELFWMRRLAEDISYAVYEDEAELLETLSLNDERSLEILRTRMPEKVNDQLEQLESDIRSASNQPNAIGLTPGQELRLNNEFRNTLVEHVTSVFDTSERWLVESIEFVFDPSEKRIMKVSKDTFAAYVTMKYEYYDGNDSGTIEDAGAVILFEWNDEVFDVKGVYLETEVDRFASIDGVLAYGSEHEEVLLEKAKGFIDQHIENDDLRGPFPHLFVRSEMNIDGWNLYAIIPKKDFKGDRALKDDAIFQKEGADLSTESQVGGIDLTPDHWNLQTRGFGTKYRIPANVPSPDSASINGFVPVIIHITPISNYPLLIREQPKKDDSHLILSAI